MVVVPAGHADRRAARADVQALYEAAAAASWADAPGWWVRQWNGPHAGYYRPLTSMLVLAGQKAFGPNLDAHNRVTWLMHGLNTRLLYSLAFLLLRRLDNLPHVPNRDAPVRDRARPYVVRAQTGCSHADDRGCRRSTR
ncbi:MAG TPA: hypothetical protein VKT77_04985 [Chthonomonadaceae bacterium]|nr:hypothetical protein [Chthonomonadaceae bacterium]